MFSLEKIKKQPTQKTVVGLEDRTRYTVGRTALQGPEAGAAEQRPGSP